MRSRANTFGSEICCIEFRYGVTLKSRALRRWLKRNNYTQAFFAEWLGMSKRKFLRKLYKRQRFHKDEISALVRFMGTRAAINVIWFPSIKEKKRIQKYVWEGNMSDTYEAELSVFTSMGRNRREIERQARENGEDWEQSEEFEDFIFDSDELPSRKFMRRRNG